MVKQIAKGKEFAKNAYWSAVGMATATMLTLQPVLATGTGTSTIWNRFSTILKDVYTTFITGCSRGVDLWAADIVLEMRRHDKRLKLICAIPFDGFADTWPIDWQKHLESVKKHADWIQVISKEYYADVYQKRNIWMVTKAMRIIAVCNGKPSGTLNTVRFAEEQNVPVHMIQV